MAYTRRVQYYETDQMGIVHHSNYIRWFEEARTEFMRDNNIDYNLVEQNHKVMMPVIAVECNYKQGAKYGEIVTIETSISKFNGIKLVFSYNIYDKNNNLLVYGSSSHCFVNMEFKPVNIKKTNADLYCSLNSLLKE